LCLCLFTRKPTQVTRTYSTDGYSQLFAWIALPPSLLPVMMHHGDSCFVACLLVVVVVVVVVDATVSEDRHDRVMTSLK